MKAYLEGPHKQTGFIDVADKPMTIYLDLPDRNLSVVKNESDITDPKFNRAVYEYEGLMPVYRFVGIEN